MVWEVGFVPVVPPVTTQHDGYFCAAGGVLADAGLRTEDNSQSSFRVLFHGDGTGDEIAKAFNGDDIWVGIVQVDNHKRDGMVMFLKTPDSIHGGFRRVVKHLGQFGSRCCSNDAVMYSRIVIFIFLVFSKANLARTSTVSKPENQLQKEKITIETYLQIGILFTQTDTRNASIRVYFNLPRLLQTSLKRLNKLP